MVATQASMTPLVKQLTEAAFLQAELEPFEPQLVKKHQTHMSDEIECKIISMFGLGMSYLDIAGHISEIYGLDVSNATISVN